MTQIFRKGHLLPPGRVPGRGLEPLWISPPDPKSGASANFATLATPFPARRTVLEAVGYRSSNPQRGRQVRWVVRILSLRRRTSGAPRHIGLATRQPVIRSRGAIGRKIVPPNQPWRVAD